MFRSQLEERRKLLRLFQAYSLKKPGVLSFAIVKTIINRGNMSKIAHLSQLPKCSERFWLRLLSFTM